MKNKTHIKLYFNRIPLLFVLKQKGAKSSRKFNASTHNPAHPRKIFRPSRSSLWLAMGMELFIKVILLRTILLHN
jgi:hypothetical protein